MKKGIKIEFVRWGKYKIPPPPPPNITAFSSFYGL